MNFYNYILAAYLISFFSITALMLHNILGLIRTRADYKKLKDSETDRRRQSKHSAGS